MFNLNVEKGSQRWFGIAILILAIVLVLSSIGRADLTLWLAVIFSITLGLVLYSEGAVVSWVKKSGWKSLSGGDAVVVVSFVFGTFLILNGLFLIQFIRNVSPVWLVNFISINGIIGGVVAGLLAIYLIFAPRPE